MVRGGRGLIDEGRFWKEAWRGERAAMMDNFWAQFLPKQVDEAKICHILRRYLSPEGHILDVGGGTGRYALLLAGKVRGYWLVDYSDDMLRIAHERLKATRTLGGDPIHLARADGESLPFEDRSLDIVLCVDVIRHLPREKMRLFMEELRRVTCNYLFYTYLRSLNGKEMRNPLNPSEVDHLLPGPLGPYIETWELRRTEWWSQELVMWRR